MNAKQAVAAIVTGAVITFGGFAGVIHLDNNLRMERKASDRCWIKGGTYKDGTCETPEDRMSPEAKVCTAMRGSYAVTTGDKFTCYEDKGSVLEIPDLTGKEVILTEDGAVLVNRR